MRIRRGCRVGENGSSLIGAPKKSALSSKAGIFARRADYCWWYRGDMLKRWRAGLSVVAAIGLLLLVAPASAHKGHDRDTQAASVAASPTVASPVTVASPATAALQIAESGSHCPSDSGRCCCRSESCTGSYKPRVFALRSTPSPLPSPDLRRDVGITAPEETLRSAVVVSTKRARAPPILP